MMKFGINNKSNVFYVKKNNKQVWFFKFLFFFSLFLILVILILKFIFSSSYFNVKSISVNNTSVDQDRILIFLRNEMYQKKWRGILGHNNILFWALGEKPGSIYNYLPVKNLYVLSSLLKREVKINLELRKPAGIICDIREECYLFDEEGLVFAKSPKSEGSLVLTLTDNSGRLITVGQKIFPKQLWFENFVKITKAVIENNFGIAGIFLNDLNRAEWFLITSRGFTFYFGFEFVPEELSYILKNLGSQINLSEAEYIDLRVPGRIYYK